MLDITKFVFSVVMVTAVGVTTAAAAKTSVVEEVTADNQSPVDDVIFGSWSPWSSCSARCTQTRARSCRDQDLCRERIQRQKRDCDFGGEKCARSAKGESGQGPERNEPGSGESERAGSIQLHSWSIQLNSGSTLPNSSSIQPKSGSTTVKSGSTPPNQHNSKSTQPSQVPPQPRPEKPKAAQRRSKPSRKHRAQSHYHRRHGSARRAISRRLQNMVFTYLYHDWSAWSMCTRSCKQRRFRTCAMPSMCKNVKLMEEKRCWSPGTRCEEKWGEETDDGDLMDELDAMEDELTTPSKTPPLEPESPPVPPDPLTCGDRPPTPSLRIVGGYESRKGSWPWQVAITTKKGEQYCGGTLIAPQWVLTAAHCLRKNGRRRKVTLRVGEHDLGTVDGTELDIGVGTDYVHPDFDADTIDNDIALVRLAQPVPDWLNLTFACLPRSELMTNTLCYAVGWGKIKETHRFGTDVLREAPVPLVADDKCQDAFEYELTASQMCAGYRRGGIDTCAGDSGGPLMCEVRSLANSRRTQWVVYGVTSFGEGCGDKGKYGIYTKVTMFHDWIHNITNPV